MNDLRRLAVLLALLVLLALSSRHAHPGPGRDSFGRPMPAGPVPAGTPPAASTTAQQTDRPSTVIHLRRS